MRAVLHMAWRDLRARVRDRSAITLGLIAPLALIVVFSFTLDADSANDPSQLALVAASDAQVQLVAALRTGALEPLESDGAIELVELEDEAAARDALDDGDIEAAIIVSAGEVVVLRGGGAIVAGAIAESVARQTTTLVDAVEDIVAVRVQLDPTVDVGAAAVDEIAADIVRQSGAVQLRESDVPGLDPMAVVTAGMATFFLFFAVQFGILGLLEERNAGTLRRILAAPVSQAQVLLAKLLGTWLLGLASMTSLLVIARVVLDVELGSPFGLLLLAASGSAAATATVTLVVGVTRSPEQASAAQGMIAIVLGLLGGSFFSMARAGGLAADVTLLTPHYWFGEGVARLGTTDDAAWTVALEPAGWLLLFAVVIGAPGMLLARRAVRP